MKKNPRRKLQLRRKSLKVLDASGVDRVQGGMLPTTSDDGPTWYNCRGGGWDGGWGGGWW